MNFNLTPSIEAFAYTITFKYIHLTFMVVPVQPSNASLDKKGTLSA